MIDVNEAQAAMWARVATLSAATTGSTSLSATGTGYARAAGSFITDGFYTGMEVLAAGFSSSANNGYSVVKSVTPTVLTIVGGRSTESAGSGKTITCGLPETIGYEGIPVTPINGRPFVEEEMVPATSEVFTFRANGGRAAESGLYVIRWYGLSGRGPEAIRAAVGGLKALFAPGTPITLATATDQLRVPSRPGPFAGGIRPVEGGWALLTLNIPWTAWSLNTVT